MCFSAPKLPPPPPGPPPPPQPTAQVLVRPASQARAQRLAARLGTSQLRNPAPTLSLPS